MANNIVELQNRPENIKMLKAMRHLYSKVGKLTKYYFIFCVLFPIVISFAKPFISSEDYQVLFHFMIAYNLLSLMAGLWLECKIKKERVLAAKIQQQFDCNVFELQWNRYTFGAQPSLEDINSNAKSSNDEDFLNWYDRDVDIVDRMLAVIICQRINLTYDVALRKKFLCSLTIISIIILIIILGIAFYEDEGLRTTIVFVAVPLIPVIRWFFSTRKANSDNIEKCERIKKIIDDYLEEYRNNGIVFSDIDLCEIQNCIYDHRKTAFKIPDFIYNKMRSKQEEATHITVGELITRYIN
ncbi:S-4TM family putative pore-forming effector [Phocaeicola plebeius]|jgi:hypothetical protein|uniref:S-4TM family putative pore-forming effector n=1 Tax=Phocaeicola plebeius TaxID=310297 RepID=UPI0030788E82